jgi:hypothetical protein
MFRGKVPSVAGFGGQDFPATALFRVVVLLTTGNEAGCDAVSVTRPA